MIQKLRTAGVNVGASLFLFELSRRGD